MNETLPTPPCPVPETWISGTLLICERVYRDATSGLHVLAGVFNRSGISVENPLAEKVRVLPLPQAHLYIRLLVSSPRKVNWKIFFTCKSFGSHNAGKTMPLATGTTEINPENNGLSEFAIPTLGAGFELTESRRALLNSASTTLVIGQFELYGDGAFLAAHTLEIKYTTDIEGAYHDSTKTTGGDLQRPKPE